MKQLVRQLLPSMEHGSGSMTIIEQHRKKANTNEDPRDNTLAVSMERFFSKTSGNKLVINIEGDIYLPGYHL